MPSKSPLPPAMTRLGPAARSLGRSALDFVFPPRCAACGSGGAFVCGACRDALVPATRPRCGRCWRPGVYDGLCGRCRIEPPAFDNLRAAFVYEGVARELVHALKYRGLTVLAGPMASMMRDVFGEHELAADIVVPVPLAGLRRRTRGYNQAEALARSLGRELGLSVEPRALARRRGAPPQARSADAQARRQNVAGAFEGRPRLVAGARVLLVDDVTTTGATLSASAAALRAAGASSVSAVAFARED